MPWSLRRAIRLGPLRINLSRRGVGLSAGVKGARVGVDASGKPYAGCGRGGAVDFLRSAQRELASIPKDVQLQITERINGLTTTPLPHGVQKLRGEEKLYRVRVGDYRVLYEVDHAAQSITIAAVGNRRDIYRDR